MRKRVLTLLLIVAMLTMVFALASCANGGRCAGGHTWVNVEKYSDPTCTEYGQVYDRCSVCGIRRKPEIPALGHDFVLVEGTEVDPTCVEPGYEGDFICVRDGCDYIKQGAIIPAHGHKDEDSNDICDICGGNPCNHIWGDWTDNGDGTHTRVCTLKDSHTETADHIHNDGEVIKPATCTQEGEILYTCIDCGSEVVDTIGVIGHAYPEKWQDNGENHVKVCGNGCGEDLVEPHTHIETDRVPATCGSAEVITYTCECGNVKTAEGDPALEHNYLWTDNGDGTCTAVCKNDSNHIIFEQPHVDADSNNRCDNCQSEIVCEHNYEENVTLSPTCTKDGEKTYTCSKCEESYTESIPATGHEYQDTVVHPTCTTDGYATHSCVKCGEVFNSSTIPAPGHIEGNIVVENEVAVTCTTDGTHDNVIYCTVCGEELSRESVTSPALGHTSGAVVVENSVDPDCVNEGSYDNVTYCTVCDIETSRETITVSATGHTSGEVVVENEVAPDCVNTGSYDNVIYCSVCGEKLDRETITIDALGHYTHDGNIHDCDRCGEALSAIMIEDGQLLAGDKILIGHTGLEQYYVKDENEIIIANYPNVFLDLTSEFSIDKAYTINLNRDKSGNLDFDKYVLTVEIDEATGAYAFKTSFGKYLAMDSTGKLICVDSISNNVLWNVDAIGGANGNDMSVPNYTKITNVAQNKELNFASYPTPVTRRVTKLGGTVIEIFRGVNVGHDVTYTDNGDGTHTIVCESGCTIPATENGVEDCFDCNIDFVCDGCGAHHECEHQFTTEVTDPTCTEKGYTTYTCTLCGDTHKDDYVDELGHTAGVIVVENNVAPTCTVSGSYDNVTYCTVCNVETSRETITVSATGHTSGEVVVENNVDPDCVNAGSYDNVIYCTVCGEELDRETITVDALGHADGEVVVENNVAPTCTVDGSYDNVTYCTVCIAEVNRETVVVDALGHYTHDGNIHDCDRCGEALSEMMVVDGQLMAGDKILIGNTDLEQYYVKDENEIIIANYPNVFLDMTSEFSIDKKYTITLDRDKSGNLDFDKYVLTVEIDEETGSYIFKTSFNKYLAMDSTGKLICVDSVSNDALWTVKAIGGANGTLDSVANYTKIINVGQGKELKFGSNPTPVTRAVVKNSGTAIEIFRNVNVGHDVTYTDNGDGTHTIVCESGCTIPATENGVEDCFDCNIDFVCDGCGAHHDCEHQFTTTVTDPTCTEQGYTTYTCTLCGDVHKDNYVDALGHNYLWTDNGDGATHNGICQNDANHTITDEAHEGMEDCVCDKCDEAYHVSHDGNISVCDRCEVEIREYVTNSTVIENGDKILIDFGSNSYLDVTLLTSEPLAKNSAQMTINNGAGFFDFNKYTLIVTNYNAGNFQLVTEDGKYFAMKGYGASFMLVDEPVASWMILDDYYGDGRIDFGFADGMVLFIGGIKLELYRNVNIGHDVSCGGGDTHVITCTGCDFEYAITESDMIIVDAVEPTCTTTGLSEGKLCSVCGETIVEQNEIPANGHIGDAPVIENNIDPDCVNTGSYDSVVYCSVCGVEVSRTNVVVDALGHTYQYERSTYYLKNPEATDRDNDADFGIVSYGNYCTVCDGWIWEKDAVWGALNAVYTEAEMRLLLEHGYSAGTTKDVEEIVVTRPIEIYIENINKNYLDAENNVTNGKGGTVYVNCNIGYTTMRTEGDLDTMFITDTRLNLTRGKPESGKDGKFIAENYLVIAKGTYTNAVQLSTADFETNGHALVLIDAMPNGNYSNVYFASGTFKVNPDCGEPLTMVDFNGEYVEGYPLAKLLNGTTHSGVVVNTVFYNWDPNERDEYILSCYAEPIEGQDNAWLIVHRTDIIVNVPNNGPTCTEGGYVYHKCVCYDYEVGSDGKAIKYEVDSLGHDDSGDWIYDGKGGHSKICARCGITLESGVCAGTTATCTEDGICEVCGGAYQKAGHKDSKWLSDDDVNGTHYKECTVCGELLGIEAEHNFVTEEEYFARKVDNETNSADIFWGKYCSECGWVAIYRLERTVEGDTYEVYNSATDQVVVYDDVRTEAHILSGENKNYVVYPVKTYNELYRLLCYGYSVKLMNDIAVPEKGYEKQLGSYELEGLTTISMSMGSFKHIENPYVVLDLNGYTLSSNCIGNEVTVYDSDGNETEKVYLQNCIIRTNVTMVVDGMTEGSKVNVKELFMQIIGGAHVEIRGGSYTSTGNNLVELNGRDKNGNVAQHASRVIVKEPTTTFIVADVDDAEIFTASTPRPVPETGTSGKIIATLDAGIYYHWQPSSYNTKEGVGWTAVWVRKSEIYDEELDAWIIKVAPCSVHVMSEDNGFVCSVCGEATYAEVTTAEGLASALVEENDLKQTRAMIYVEGVGYFDCSSLSTLGSVVAYEKPEEVPADELSTCILSIEELYGSSGQDLYCLRLLYAEEWAYLGIDGNSFNDNESGDIINWHVIDADGGVYIQNVETGQYLCATADGFGVKDEADSSCVIKIVVFNVK